MRMSSETLADSAVWLIHIYSSLLLGYLPVLQRVVVRRVLDSPETERGLLILFVNLAWPRQCPDIWPNIILNVFVRVFSDEINI